MPAKTFVQKQPRIEAIQYDGTNERELQRWVRKTVEDAAVVAPVKDPDAEPSPVERAPFARVEMMAGSKQSAMLQMEVGDWLVLTPGQSPPFQKWTDAELTAAWEPEKGKSS